jgi:hypothetical protein
LGINWSCEDHKIYAGFGILVLFWVTVAGMEGFGPSMYSNRS